MEDKNIYSSKELNDNMTNAVKKTMQRKGTKKIFKSFAEVKEHLSEQER